MLRVGFEPTILVLQRRRHFVSHIARLWPAATILNIIINVITSSGAATRKLRHLLCMLPQRKTVEHMCTQSKYQTPLQSCFICLVVSPLARKTISWLDLYDAYYLSNCQNWDSHVIFHSCAYIFISPVFFKHQFPSFLYRFFLHCRIYQNKNRYYNILYTEGLGETEWIRTGQILCAQKFVFLSVLKTGGRKS
jgi:hypothetical protein